MLVLAGILILVLIVCVGLFFFMIFSKNAGDMPDEEVQSESVTAEAFDSEDEDFEEAEDFADEDPEESAPAAAETDPAVISGSDSGAAYGQSSGSVSSTLPPEASQKRGGVSYEEDPSTYEPEMFADYDVVVNAPDGGVNIRSGPGVEHGKLQENLIPNGTRLHLEQIGYAANGKKWGKTTYNGIEGWIFLGQTTRVQ